MSPAHRTVVVLVASAVGLAVTISACVWQYQRGLAKDRLAADTASALKEAPIALSVHRVSEPDVRYRRVLARGTFVPGSTVLLDNQARGAQPGYLVFTALRLGEERQVVVKRGWVAGSLDRSILPDVPMPSGPVEIEGIALPPATRYFELGEVSLNERVWPHVTVARYEQRFGASFQPIVLEQQNDTGDGLSRDWPVPSGSASAKNYGYALQWGAMALLILGANVYYGIRRFRASRPA